MSFVSCFWIAQCDPYESSQERGWSRHLVKVSWFITLTVYTYLRCSVICLSYHLELSTCRCWNVLSRPLSSYRVRYLRVFLPLLPKSTFNSKVYLQSNSYPWFVLYYSLEDPNFLKSISQIPVIHFSIYFLLFTWESGNTTASIVKLCMQSTKPYSTQPKFGHFDLVKWLTLETIQKRKKFYLQKANPYVNKTTIKLISLFINLSTSTSEAPSPFSARSDSKKF